jgi:tetratricopeptide (TPR) repeat protein
LPLSILGCGGGVPDFTPEELAEAETQVREAFRLHDYEFGAELGQRWIARAPDAMEIKAWTVANLAKAGRAFLAEEMAEKMAMQYPGSPWSSFATGAAITWTPDEANGKKALEASEKALAGLPDVVGAVLLRGEAFNRFLGADAAMAFVETLSPELRAHPDVRAASAAAFWPTYEAPSDSVLGRMLAIHEGILQEDPDHLTANLEAAMIFLYKGGLEAKNAFAHMERAAAATPSPHTHASFWYSLFRDSGVGEEEQYAQVAADVRDMVENGGESPARWAALGGWLRRTSLPELAEEVEARVLEEYPRDPAVEAVLANRFQALAREIWVAETPAETQGTEKRRELAEMLRSFIDRRQHHDRQLLLEARWDLFLLHREDPETDPETLKRAVKQVVDQMEIWPGPNASTHFGTLVMTLTDGLGAPEEARRVMDLWEVVLRDRGAFQDGSAEGEGGLHQSLKAEESLFSTALASVLLQEGRLDDAEAELARSGELDPENWYADMAFSLSYLYSGRLMEKRAQSASTEGDRERYLRSAEGFYLEGMRVAYWADPTLGLPWTNPNETALADLYEKRHGGPEGFEEYILAATGEDLEERKAEILAQRIQDPQPMAPFVLESLDGEEVRSESLLGRVLVVNFWGTW